MNFGYTSTMHLLPTFTSTPQRNRVYHMDALALLRALPSGSVHCIVTSPPYFGLRHYGVEGQIGLEDTPQAFIARLVAVFREARRVLRDDGTCWVNMGDTYGRGTRGQNVNDSLRATNLRLHGQLYPTSPMLENKQRLMMPARLAIALQDDGWYLRDEIVWHKPNPMPESVTDRTTKAHEMVYLLAKSERYFYDGDAIREPALNEGKVVTLGEKSLSKGQAQGIGIEPTGNGKADSVTVGSHRNRRSVWSIATEPTPFAHFATFPRKLIEPMILAGCPARTCGVCGKGWVREVEIEQIDTSNWTPFNGKNSGQDDQAAHKRIGGNVNRLRMAGRDHDNPFPQRQTIGFHPACDCHADSTRPGLVLDMFGGSGTTAIVARALGRDYIIGDLSHEYVELARQRLAMPYSLPMFETLGIAV